MGQAIDDVRILKTGKLAIAYRKKWSFKYFSAKKLTGFIVIWDPLESKEQQRICITVRQKHFPRPREHFIYIAMGVKSAYPEKYPNKPRLPPSRPLKRPLRMRLGLSKTGGLLGVYAFGDLYAYRMSQENRAKQVLLLKDILYINKWSYYKNGFIVISHDDRSIGFVGKGDYVRLVDVATGKIRNISHKFKTMHAFSHALPSRENFAHLFFDPKTNGKLWISTDSLISTYRPNLTSANNYVLEKGSVVRKRLNDIKSESEQWSINKIIVTKRWVLLLAESRILVLNKKNMKIWGWIGANPNIDLGNFNRGDWLRKRPYQD